MHPSRKDVSGCIDLRNDFLKHKVHAVTTSLLFFFFQMHLLLPDDSVFLLSHLEVSIEERQKEKELRGERFSASVVAGQ